MNRHFVNIKVDREERPDLDEIYMAATQAMNQGQGGWPMTVFLTPDQQPFFAGTYFPPEDRYGRPGFSTLLKSHRRALEDASARELVEQAASSCRAAAARREHGGPGHPWTPRTRSAQAFQQLARELRRA